MRQSMIDEITMTRLCEIKLIELFNQILILKIIEAIVETIIAILYYLINI